MTITKQRALEAVRRSGRLSRFIQQLQAETVAAWDLDEIDGTQEDKDAFLADYIDEVRKEKERGPQGPQTLPDLQLRLSRVWGRVNNRVVQDLILFCAPQLPYADDQLLVQLYLYVSAFPHSSIQARFKEKDGLVFNAPYNSGMPCRKQGTVLFTAFQNDTKPLLAKFTLDPEDVEREHSVLSELANVPGIVGPVSLVRSTPSDVTSGRRVRTKCALLMPLYPATLQQVPRPMGATCLLRCGQQLKLTLEGIHSRGYGHNDIKAANIFLDSNGNCILGDFGAAQRLGKVPIESTDTHWPADVTQVTSATADFFMLAVVLLECAGVHELCQNPTLAMLHAATERLEDVQLRAFVLELLDAC